MIKLLLILLFFPCTVNAGEISKKLLYTFGSMKGKTTHERLDLSVDYDSNKYWIDERVSRDISQEVSFENFLGAGWKHNISAVWDSSVGVIWQHDEDTDNYLGSLRGRYKLKYIELIGFYQPYINISGYIVKGSIINKGFIQEFEYRSNNKKVVLKTGFKF